MIRCDECGQHVRDPKTRHSCPHGRLCIRPSIHSKRNIAKRFGTDRADREVYCKKCSDAYYGRGEEMIPGFDKLTEYQLAEKWRVHPRTLGRWRKKKDDPIPHYLVNRQVWYKVPDILEWLERRKVK